MNIPTSGNMEPPGRVIGSNLLPPRAGSTTLSSGGYTWGKCDCDIGDFLK